MEQVYLSEIHDKFPRLCVLPIQPLYYGFDKEFFNIRPIVSQFYQLLTLASPHAPVETRFSAPLDFLNDHIHPLTRQATDQQHITHALRFCDLCLSEKIWVRKIIKINHKPKPNASEKSPTSNHSDNSL